MKTALLWFFGRRIDAVLNCREFAESAMLLLLMVMIMMVRVMVLRGWRGLPYATHQAKGTSDTSTAASAAGGGARRHCPTALTTEGSACQYGSRIHMRRMSRYLENSENLSAMNVLRRCDPLRML